jgi:hypothetical protein
MTSRIKAINLNRPRVRINQTMELREVSQYIAGITSLSTVDVLAVVLALRMAIVDYASRGIGVKLEGLGTFLPNIDLDGAVDLLYRIDSDLLKDLNREPFAGLVKNKRNIGKTPDELVAQWNAEHPDDPVV